VSGRSPAATHAVELVWPDGESQTIAVEEGERIVDAAEAAGVSVPYGCLHGACGTCTAELLEGSVTHQRPPRALKDRALDSGYVLPCVATPETDCRLRVGHGIQAEVVGTPFK
jgi:ferredoxin